MLDQNKIKFLKSLLNKCEGFISSEANVIKGGEDVWGIEFSEYQSFQINIKPIFDMSDEEVNALVNLFAYGLPVLNELVDENMRKDAKIDAMLDAFESYVLISSEKRRNLSNLKLVRDESIVNESNLTVGEK